MATQECKQKLRKPRSGKRGHYSRVQAERVRYRTLIGRRVSIATDRQTHALVLAYARREDLNVQSAVTRLLGYGLAVVVAQGEEVERERQVREILKPVGGKPK